MLLVSCGMCSTVYPRSAWNLCRSSKTRHYPRSTSNNFRSFLLLIQRVSAATYFGSHIPVRTCACSATLYPTKYRGCLTVWPDFSEAIHFTSILSYCYVVSHSHLLVPVAQHHRGSSSPEACSSPILGGRWAGLMELTIENMKSILKLLISTMMMLKMNASLL